MKTEQLAQLINKILQHNKVPKELKTIILILFKKCDVIKNNKVSKAKYHAQAQYWL